MKIMIIYLKICLIEIKKKRKMIEIHLMIYLIKIIQKKILKMNKKKKVIKKIIFNQLKQMRIIIRIMNLMNLRVLKILLYKNN
jgi:hypothetical protein